MSTRFTQRPASMQKQRRHTTSVGPFRLGICFHTLTAQTAIGQVLMHCQSRMRTGGPPTGTLSCGVATGYFTTRPSTKLYSRVASNVLRAARQLEVVLGTTPDGPSTQQLARVVALMQHHDAITGTDRFHVNQDYRKLIASGISEAQRIISRHVRSLLLSSGADQESGSSDTGPRCV